MIFETLLGDMIVMALPVAIYLKKRCGADWKAWCIFCGCVVSAVALYCYVGAKSTTGFEDAFGMIVGYFSRLLIWILHWISWLRMASREEKIGDRAFPLTTIWALIMLQGVALQSVYLIGLSVVCLVLCSVIFTFLNKKTALVEETSENIENFEK